ncbi:SOSS complex subunit C isoform X2 [Lagenorhynchus albirostris]|uniref:SOSS complex subunit C isoform X2 n=1 Tax=Lagenorhynchus albirostris TaxID=27610 RepID=UPI0028E27408|nr:SOSS complex subunit C isoform X2 [Lagenorhynchus albirostris]
MAAPFRFFLLRTATAFLHLALVTQTSLVHQTESSLTCDAQPFHSTGSKNGGENDPKQRKKSNRETERRNRKGNVLGKEDGLHTFWGSSPFLGEGKKKEMEQTETSQKVPLEILPPDFDYNHSLQNSEG